jgi:hypothetical protein
MRWDFWEFMILFLSLEIPLVIAAELSPTAARWLPIGKSHFRQLATLALTATFIYGLFVFAVRAAP